MHLVHTYRSRCEKLSSDRSEPNSECGSLRIAGSTLSVVELSLMDLVKLNRAIMSFYKRLLNIAAFLALKKLPV